LPISASAGLLFWRDSEPDKPIVLKNVQNMALLVAATTPLTEKERSKVQMVDDSALVAEASPLSTEPGSLIYKPESDQISVYVVREGDTISQIAEMYDVSVNTIKWGNNLTSNTLKTGQTLVILPISGVKHVVVKGDTLASIAKKYKGDVDEIIAYNDLNKDSSLVAGSIVIVPDGEVVNIPYSGSSSSSGSSVRPGVKEYAGYYLRPLAGGKKTQGLHGNNGIDLAAPIGTPILAAAGGEVIVSRTGGWNGGYGNYIVVRHSNGTQTLYAHTNKNNVSAGDTVNQGDVIGFVGSTGKSTGPHVHFEIRGARNPF
jgi:LysM repeat protein